MPFTVAHAVVALPFARSHRWSAAAIACGAVAPDLPLFLTGGAGYGLTHEPWAVVTLDVGLGLLLLALWWGLVRPGLLAVAPASVRSRVRARRSFPVLLLPVAVALGAATHVLWDSFTHRHRLGEALLPVLGEQLGPFVLTSWLQYASGTGGLLVLAAFALRTLTTGPTSPEASTPVLGRATRPAAVALLLIPALAAGTAVATAIATGGFSASGAAYTAATVLLPVAGLVVAAIGAVARIRGRSRADGEATRIA